MEVESCAFNLGQAENFRSAEFFRGLIFSAGADPVCQGGFGRKAETPDNGAILLGGYSPRLIPPIHPTIPGSVVSEMRV